MIRVGLIFYFLGVFVLENCHSQATSYKGYRVYETVNEEKDPVLKVEIDNAILLNEKRAYTETSVFRIASYLVPPQFDDSFKKALEKLNATSRLTVDDLDSLINEEKKFDIGDDWTPDVDFHSKVHLAYDEMIRYFSFIETIINPDNMQNIARIENTGQSFEKRAMNGVLISSDHTKNKPVIFVEAGLIGREWVAMAAARYLIDQLVVNYTDNKQVLDKVDFFILPISNPDGYEYTRRTDRLWMKNRSGAQYRSYPGVNLNRNFNFSGWNQAESNDPSSDNYKGLMPFSEPETKNIIWVGEKYKERLISFISVQAFGSLILYPYGYKESKPFGHIAMEFVADKVAAALNKSASARYSTGQSYKMLNDCVGNPADYFKDEFQIPMVFTMKLSSINRATFVLPPAAVSTIVKDAFEGFKAFAEYTPKIIFPPDTAKTP